MGPRVIWMSSLQALARYYDKDDLQLIKTGSAYEGSKYQIELISSQLDRVALQAPKESKKIRHFITDPGVTYTNFSAKLLNFATAIVQLVLSYVVCMECVGAEFFADMSLLHHRFGSPDRVITLLLPIRQLSLPCNSHLFLSL